MCVIPWDVQPMVLCIVRNYRREFPTSASAMSLFDNNDDIMVYYTPSKYIIVTSSIQVASEHREGATFFQQNTCLCPT